MLAVKTSAPAAYDYSCVVSREPTTETDARGRTMYVVLLDGDDTQQRNQMDRYGSGLYPVQVLD